jgi:signal transduction histidine kinase
MLAVAGSGLLLGVGGGVLIATSGHLVHPVAYGLQVAIVVIGTVGVALYWAVHRPGNRLALGLLAYALAAAGLSLQGASDPLLHSIGVLFDAPMFLLGFYVVFAFPLGRMIGVVERVLLAAVAWALLASFLPWFFFSPVVSGGAPLAGCNTSCPTNALMIADRPGIATGLGTTEEYLAVIVAAAIAIGFCYRLATSSGPRRRSLLPVYTPALLLTVPFAIFHGVGAGLIDLSAKTHDTIGWFVTVGRTTLSFGFLLAIVQTMVFAGVALKRIVGGLGQEDDAVHLRKLVAEALDDPPLELAFELVPGSAIFVDSRGDPTDPTHLEGERSATALQRRGKTVAYIVHDSSLESDPELVQAAGQAILLALEGGRLESELQSKLAELRTSRGRIVAAGEAERRKIERDLHDGAQQRLLAIQVKLALARERAGNGELAEELEAIEVDAAEAVEDLRMLAHGIYPTVLLERGLADAFRSVGRTAPIPVRVTDEGIGRCSPTIEAAIYFCGLEAMQNAIKHAGPNTHVAVTLARRSGGIEFSVEDDGVGMETQASTDGAGLTSMRDRIGAVGGELEISSSPRGGTRIRGTVPEEAAFQAGAR